MSDTATISMFARLVYLSGDDEPKAPASASHLN